MQLERTKESLHSPLIALENFIFFKEKLLPFISPSGISSLNPSGDFM